MKVGLLVVEFCCYRMNHSQFKSENNPSNLSAMQTHKLGKFIELQKIKFIRLHHFSKIVGYDLIGFFLNFFQVITYGIRKTLYTVRCIG